MKLLFLLALALPAFSQCTIVTINSSDPVSTGPAKLNANFSSLNTCKPQRFSGTTVPGNVTGSLRGDFYQNTATNLTYQCFAVGPCTTVAAGNWVLLGSGGGTGTVTVVGTGNLASTAIMTGGGSQTAQTQCATCTLDSSGNYSTPGGATFGAGTSNPGAMLLSPGAVAALPVCNSGADGTRRSVTDATATTFMSTVVGGGSNHVPVFCNGTNWVIG